MSRIRSSNWLRDLIFVCSLLFLAVPLSLGQSPPTPSQPVEGERPVELLLHLFDDGYAAVSLGLDPGGISDERTATAFHEAVGCEGVADDASLMCAPAAFSAASPFVRRFPIRPGPIAAALYENPASSLELSITFPDGLDVRLQPAPQSVATGTHYQVATWEGDALPSEIVVDWRPSVRLLLGSIAFLLLPLLVAFAMLLLVRWRFARAQQQEFPKVWMIILRYRMWVALPAWLIAAYGGTTPIQGLFPLFGIPVFVAIALAAGISFVSGTLGFVLFQLGVRRITNQLFRADMAARQALHVAIWYCVALYGGLGLVLAVLGAAPSTSSPWVPLGGFVTAGLLSAIASQRSRKAMGLAVHAVFEGELKDGVYNLAKRMGVPLHGLFLVPRTVLPFTNAFASGKMVVLTEDLVRALSRSELDAIIAHELAHVKMKHGSGVHLILPGIAVGLFTFALSFLRTVNEDGVLVELVPLPVFIALIVVVSVLAFGFASRRIERKADAAALRAVEDPGSLLRALTKVHEKNLLPSAWTRAESKLLTHPSLTERIRLAAGIFNVTPEQASEWAMPRADEEPYPLPRGVGNNGFTSVYRHRLLNGSALLQPFAMAAVGGAIAAAGGFAGAPLWMLALSLIAAALLFRVLFDFAFNQWDRSRIGASLSIPHQDRTGLRVGLSPSAEPLIYDGWFVWDRGFLELSATALSFRGEQARFSLAPGDVVRIALSPRLPLLLPYHHVVIEWRREDREGVVRLFSEQPRTLWNGPATDHKLLRAIEEWRQTSSRSTGGAVPEPLPQLDGVVGRHPATLKSVGVALASLFLPLMVCGIAGIAVWEFTGQAMPSLLVPSFAVFAVLPGLVPYWRLKDPAANEPLA